MLLIMKLLLIMSLLIFAGSSGYATDPQNENTVEHEVVRGIAVLPIDTGGLHQQESDIAWDNTRRFLVDTKRFFVLSKKTLIHKDSYVARKTILNVDAMILGKLLEADCIITTYLTPTDIKMVAYSGIDGFILWQNSIQLNPANSTDKQLVPLTQKLIQNFLASFPYQAFQIVDPIIGTPTFEEGDITLAKADVGSQSHAVVGDTVQWLKIKRINSKPLFQGGGEYRVNAEGVITKIENETVLIQIKRAANLKDLSKKNLISFPAEYARLQSSYSLVKNNSISTTLLTEPLYPTETNSTQAKPLVTSVVSIGSIIALLILAL